MSNGTAGHAPDQATSLFSKIGYLMGPFLSMIDSSIVNVALVDISKSLRTSLGDTQWVVSSYLLAMSAALPLTAWLSRRFGAARVFAASVAGFTLVSVCCGLAPALGILVAARTLQGLFAAFLIPLAMTKLLDGGGDGKGGRGSLPAIFGLVLFMAPAIAPSLGGILMQLAGWPLIFFVNLPFGIFGFIVVLGTNYGEVGTKDAHFDLVGLLILSAGLAGATYGASEGTRHGWFSLDALPFWAGGLVAVAVYVARSTKVRFPAVSLRSFIVPEIAASDLVAMLTSVAAFGMIVLSLVLLQDVRGFDALSAGFAMIPQALLTGIGTGLSPKVVARFGLRTTVAGGLLLLAAGTVLLVFAGPATSIVVISLMLTGRSFAIGLAIEPLTMMINARLPHGERADGNTLFMIFQRLGGALGVSIIMTFFQKRARALGPTLRGNAPYTAFHESVVLLALVALVALVVAMSLLQRQPLIGRASTGSAAASYAGGSDEADERPAAGDGASF